MRNTRLLYPSRLYDSPTLHKLAPGHWPSRHPRLGEGAARTFTGRSFICKATLDLARRDARKGGCESGNSRCDEGGAGKSTLAVALAVASERGGVPSAVVDLDQQGSASVWMNLRAGVPPPVLATHPPRLRAVLDAAKAKGASFLVVDTPPRAGAGALEAARVADLVLIPCRPSVADLAAVPLNLDIARQAGTPAAVVLNAVPPRGSLVAQAIEALQEMGAEVCPVTLGARVAHVRAFTAGSTAQEQEPRSRAAVEIGALYRWLGERP